jgi:hypothetical protein
MIEPGINEMLMVTAITETVQVIVTVEISVAQIAI